MLFSTLVVGTLSTASTTNAEATSAVPTRVLDTRNGIGRSAAGRVGPGNVVTVTAPDVASGATSVVLNVTATDALAHGFVTVWACDEAKPATSNLNFVPGRAIPNMVVIGLAATGSGSQVCLESSADVHLLVDFMGWFSGSNDVTPTPPNRIIDTRQTSDPLRKREFRRVRVAGTQGVPANARSALLNVTVTRPVNAGFLSVVPCPASEGSSPGTSTLNFRTGETVASFTITALANDEICLYSDGAADVIVDTFGWSQLEG